MAQLNNKNLSNNIANLITLIRLIAVFITALFLTQDNGILRKWGLVILAFAFLLDSLDGYFARKLNTANNIGSLIDTLGDRITENVILFVFAYKKMIPLFVPIVFISRSFIADFIRSLAFNRGLGSFSMNKSKFGFHMVASKPSRAIYLILKFSVFLLGAFIIAYPDKNIFYSCSLSSLLVYLAVIVTVVNLLRFIGLVFDVRKMLKEIFLQH